MERSKSLKSLDILRRASILVWDIAIRFAPVWFMCGAIVPRTMPTSYHGYESVHINQVGVTRGLVG